MSVAPLDPASLTLQLRASPAHAVVAREAVDRLLAAATADADLRHRVALAVTEACANVALHAYPEGDGPLEVQARLEDRQLVVEVIDQGAGLHAHRAPGLGLGLRLMGALSDTLNVSFGSGATTRVRMVFTAQGEMAGTRPASGRRRRRRESSSG